MTFSFTNPYGAKGGHPVCNDCGASIKWETDGIYAHLPTSCDYCLKCAASHYKPEPVEEEEKEGANDADKEAERKAKEYEKQKERELREKQKQDEVDQKAAEKEKKRIEKE